MAIKRTKHETRLVNLPPGSESQRTKLRTAVDKILQGLRDAAENGVTNDAERIFSEGRQPLVADGRMIRMMPAHLADNASARTVLAAINGYDDPSAIDEFATLLDEAVSYFERRGVDLDLADQMSSPEPVIIAEAVGDASGIGTADAIAEPVIESDSWTGLSSRSKQLVAMRDQLQIVERAVAHLIENLEAPGNGGPPLDEHKEAIEALRSLHRKLGEILGSIDRGTFNDELGDSLAAESFRLGSRIISKLRGDPARYILAVTTFALLGACGFPRIGDFLAETILSEFRKNDRRDKS